MSISYDDAPVTLFHAIVTVVAVYAVTFSPLGTANATGVAGVGIGVGVMGVIGSGADINVKLPCGGGPATAIAELMIDRCTELAGFCARYAPRASTISVYDHRSDCESCAVTYCVH
jgi:hypothetical protein